MRPFIVTLMMMILEIWSGGMDVISVRAKI